jgi:hypothetical protein
VHSTLIPQLSTLVLATLSLVAGPALANETDQPDGSTWRWQDVQRVVVIPDVHGAYDAFVELLKATRVVDESLGWTGGHTHLVSLGDLLDRGGGSRAAMDLLMRLQTEAAAAGGRVHVLLGNHEHMNLVGDLRYVSRAEYAAFADEEPPGARERARADFVAAQADLDPEQLEAAFTKRYPPGFFGHRAAFRPSGRYGAWLLSLPTLITINDTAFVHGGLPRDTNDLSPAELNRSFSTDLTRYLAVWQDLVMAGVVPDDEATRAETLIGNGVLADPSNCVGERALACQAVQDNAAIATKVEEFTRLSQAFVHSTDSPLWYRGSVYCRDVFERPILDDYLGRLGANRVVVGHTPTADAVVRTIRQGRVVMADTGMLVSYYKGRPAALIIEDGELLVQYLNPAELVPPERTAGPVAYGLDAIGLHEALTAGSITQVTRDAANGPWQITLEYDQHTVKALFYPASRDKAHQLELAAYVLDQLLGLELIAPTVTRRVEDMEGTLQLSYPDAISEQQRLADGRGFSGWCPITRQFQLMYAFDLLIANAGRSATNLLYRRNTWTLHLTGHGQAFSKNRRLPDGLADDAVSLPEGVAAALAALDEDQLGAELGPLLDKTRLRAILSRRDALLKKFASN